MGSDDLTESKHATSGGSSDVSLRADHHCEGDENAHCDGDGDLRDGAECYGYGESELREHNGAL